MSAARSAAARRAPCYSSPTSASSVSSKSSPTAELFDPGVLLILNRCEKGTGDFMHGTLSQGQWTVQQMLGIHVGLEYVRVSGRCGLTHRRLNDVLRPAIQRRHYRIPYVARGALRAARRRNVRCHDATCDDLIDGGFHCLRFLAQPQ